MIGRLLDWLIGPLGALLGGLASIVAAWVAGNRQGRQNANLKAAEAYQKQREKIDAVDAPADPDAARRWLLKRGKR